MQYRYSTTSTSTAQSHSNVKSHDGPRYLPHRRQRLQRSRRQRSYRSYYPIRRTFVVTFLICFILFLGVILTITHTLGIRMIRKPATSSKTSLDGSLETTLKVSYPSKNIQISVIVMNHARPYLLQQSKLLTTLVTHPNVQSIYILHSNPHTKFNNEQLVSHFIQNDTVSAVSLPVLLNQKIHHIDAVTRNEQMGLAIRFHYCAVLCNSTKYVLHIDDDMEFDSHSVLNTLIQYMNQNSKRIVGHYGRAYNEWTAPFRHGYDTKTIYGNVEVVLTKILLLEQILCQEFFKHTHLVHDILNTTSDGIVKWNGEDIFMNLVANHYYHVPMYGPYNNYAIADLDVWDVDTTLFDHPISKQDTTIQTQQQQQLRHNSKNVDIPSTSSTTTTTEVVLENAISGNMDRNRIWNVGWYQWYIAYQKAQSHTKYRGLLWYTTKQRLYQP